MITPVENGSTCSGVAAERARDGVAACARSREARLAGAGVGVAGVDDQRADRRGADARAQMLAAHDHGRGAEAILREHAGDARAVGDAHRRSRS